MSNSTKYKKLQALCEAIESNNLSCVQKGFRKVRLSQKVCDKIYETCAKYHVSKQIYVYVHNKLKHRFICICNPVDQSMCFCSKSNPIKPRIIKEAILAENKEYIQFAHEVEGIHGNFFIGGVESNCTLDMLKWLKDMFDIFPSYTKQYWDHETQDIFHELNDQGKIIRILAKCFNNDVMTWCFDQIKQYYQTNDWISFINHEAKIKENASLISLLQINNMYQK